MGKATQRRERRLSKELQTLCCSNPRHFHRVWRTHLNGWCAEIVARGRDVRRGRPKATLTDAYTVLAKAERILQAMGPEAEGLVGTEARAVLEHECAKAVARATETWIYRFDTDSVYRMMQTRPQKRRA
ncbi:MAG: hypothetical protein AB2796_02530 [Candidatus Thiodiazotropha sp.]